MSSGPVYYSISAREMISVSSGAFNHRKAIKTHTLVVRHKDAAIEIR